MRGTFYCQKLDLEQVRGTFLCKKLDLEQIDQVLGVLAMMGGHKPAALFINNKL
jgi:hypothetical protein